MKQDTTVVTINIVPDRNMKKELEGFLDAPLRWYTDLDSIHPNAQKRAMLEQVLTTPCVILAQRLTEAKLALPLAALVTQMTGEIPTLIITHMRWDDEEEEWYLSDFYADTGAFEIIK